MESWQKELKALNPTAVLWKGEYYGTAKNIVVVTFKQNANGLPTDLNRFNLEDLIATNVLPQYPNIEYIGIWKKTDQSIYYGQGSGEDAINFCHAINSVKNMSETESDGTGGTLAVSETDRTPLIIMLILMAIVLWTLKK